MKWKCKFPQLKRSFTVLLALCIFAGCLILPASASEMEYQPDVSNIVAVVDCSTSMQASDSNWKVPEALSILVDMSPSENVRLSLVVYGTNAEIAFRDMPLSEENHAVVKKEIAHALMEVGYNRGQTDTGAALDLARSILDQQPGQNNMVLLFTDGAVIANKKGRTTEQSLQEIDSFAVYAQNHRVVVNTLGLFSPQADPAEVEQAAQQLSILKDKTGGLYHRVEDTSEIPSFVLSLLERPLQVQNLALTDPQACTVSDQPSWLYPFTIDDAYSNNITFVIPNPSNSIHNVYLTDAAGNTYAAADMPGLSWDSYTKYNGKPGYSVIRFKHLDQQPWIGSYSLILTTDAEEAPALSAFYFYDVSAHIELEADTISVMQPVDVTLYLTDCNGYRIDDAEFLNDLDVTIQIVNTENRGTEQSHTSEEIEDSSLLGFLDDAFSDKMQLTNDSFTFAFTPQRATTYQIEAIVSNGRFTRRLMTQDLSAQDQLEIESMVLTSVPHKNSPMEVRASLIQQDNHRKVSDVDFYRLSGGYATFINQTTGVSEEVEMTALENGRGLLATFIPSEEGDYTVTVTTRSRRETVQRSGPEMSFQVVDRPIEARGFIKTNYRFLASYLMGFHTGKELTFAGDSYFNDPDHDSYRLELSLSEGNGTELVYDNIFHYRPDHSQTLNFTLTALDYSGNRASVDFSIRILSMFEVIALTALFILLLTAAAAGILYLCIVHHHKRNALRGTMVMDVRLNGNIAQDLQKELHLNDPTRYPPVPLMRYYIPLENPITPDLPKDNLLKPEMTFTDKLHRHYIYLHRLLGIYAEIYRVSGYGNDRVYTLLSQVASDLRSHEARGDKLPCKLYGRDKGARFGLQNAAKRSVPFRFYLTNLDELSLHPDQLWIDFSLPAETCRPFNEQTKDFQVCGLEIRLRYLPDDAVPVKKTQKRKKNRKTAQQKEAPSED